MCIFITHHQCIELSDVIIKCTDNRANLCSLGFLTPFNFDTYQSQVNQVIEGNSAIISAINSA